MIKLSNMDIIMRMRLDCIFGYNKINICDIMNDFKRHKNLKIIMQWDHFAIGCEKIITNYCTGLENNYGTNFYKTIVSKSSKVGL